jgi:uncharacterized protein YbbK (DUF523 family)
VLSRCLEIAACRYDGAAVRSPVVRLLADHVEYVPVCPEVRIGLGVPRPPIQIEERDGDERLIQPSTGRDLTGPMTSFAHTFAQGSGEVDGLILKSRSPSCGIDDVKIHVGGEPRPERGAGMFARVMRDRHPDAALEDEARLEDELTRHRWLTRVWASARLRKAIAAGPVGIAEYHDRHAPLLAGTEGGARHRLGELLELMAVEADPAAIDALAARYRSGFLGTLKRADVREAPSSGGLEPYPPQLRP